MTNWKIISMLLFAFATRLCAEVSLLNPPEVESKVGYLQVEKDTPLPPVSNRVFILPQRDLMVLRENEDSYNLVYPAKNYSSACFVPKYAKFMVIMNKNPAENKVFFRGGLEVDTRDLILKKGEELAIKKKVPGGYVAMVKCNDKFLPFFVPANLDGISFHKESAYITFANSQRAKGLQYFNGMWMPAEKVKALQQEKKAREKEIALIWKNLKRGAEDGIVVLKGNRVLQGKLKGNDSANILFQVSGKHYWLGIDDVQPLKYHEIKLRGKLAKADRLLVKAKQSLGNDMGIARRYSQLAIKLLQGIPEINSYEHKEGQQISGAASDLVKTIDTQLQQQHKVIYDNTVFPDYVVQYHLDMGHVLLKRKFWIKPEQKCDECRATGEITCPMCVGKGKTVEKCTICIGKGVVKCKTCEGSGWRECNICGGKGYIYKKGRPRSYSYFGTSYYFPYRWRPGTIVTNGRFIAMTAPSPVFCGPTFGGTYISSGGSGEAVKAVCWKCGGTGTLKCPKTRKCKACCGRGMFLEMCIECKGKKKISCPKCLGKGFTGSVKKLPEPTKTNRLIP